MKKHSFIMKLLVAMALLITASNTYQSSISTKTTQAAVAKKASKNYYTKYQCTWYVFNRRTQAKKYIYTNWGNAKNWVYASKKVGYKVGRKPARGAIMQSTSGYYGHVAYVEQVYSNGKIKVSEYNYNKPLRYGTRILTKSTAARYNYIY
nr:CHAP domain-containing protein [Mammaliicoccus sp. Marseille-Q6498]